MDKEWDKFTKGFNDVILKEVKNYSGRLRINITQSDNINAGDNVVLLLESDYNRLISDNDKLSSQVEMLKQEQRNIEDILEVTLKTIYSEHRIQLQKKDDIIKSKDDELNRIKGILDKFTTALSGLSLWDIIRSKHKNLIKDFQDSIWVDVPQDQVQEVEKLPKKDDD